MVTRLAEQKGFDILLPIIDRLMADDVRLVILGEGDPRYEAALKLATKKYRGKLAFRTEFDEATAHLIVAGSDLALIPSRFEPAGLGAIHALRYGTIPVARAVGGLHQILRDLDAGDRDGWSFLFYDYRPEALWDTIVRAKRHFAKPEAWQDLVRAAMGRDFSWDRAVSAYETLYFETLRGPDAAGR